ncbi:hypothetical protein D9758_013214 [Tetrapyrgos nigripes]|uniref:NmrA-like domain-containing protein n=1 Tax=Tetrapyrgos nigripes TaxID=182062 RepID=A0A8H5CRI2_9AGAR|nr:hypothetical protein D9758_013214 [Tetrapyrgos nigripes]
MSSRTKILVTGATGYIGGSILSRFLSRPDFAAFDIRVLVRSPEKAKKLEALGFKSIIGSHTDKAVMVKAVSEVDVVIATADCDSVPAAQMAIKGMKKHFEETGKQPFFIHTSGTAVYVELTGGIYSTEVIYDDTNPEQIDSIAPTQPHRNVDIEILAAEKDGHFKSCIILPPTVYGTATGPLFDSKISNPHSIQIPMMIKIAMDRRRGGMVGQGKNVWPNVKVHELAEFYHILLDKCIQSPDTVSHGREGFYNLMNGEHDHYELARAISKALVAKGLADHDTPSSFTPEEEKKYFGPFAPLFGSDCRCVAARAKSMGWQPKKTTADMLDSIKEEVEDLIRNGRTALVDPMSLVPQA